MDTNTFQTTWPLFLLILAGYVAVSLFVLGGKGVYFEPYIEKEEEPKAKAEESQAQA